MLFSFLPQDPKTGVAEDPYNKFYAAISTSASRIQNGLGLRESENGEETSSAVELDTKKVRNHNTVEAHLKQVSKAESEVKRNTELQDKPMAESANLKAEKHYKHKAEELVDDQSLGIKSLEEPTLNVKVDSLKEDGSMKSENSEQIKRMVG